MSREPSVNDECGMMNDEDHRNRSWRVAGLREIAMGFPGIAEWDADFTDSTDPALQGQSTESTLRREHRMREWAMRAATVSDFVVSSLVLSRH